MTVPVSPAAAAEAAAELALQLPAADTAVTAMEGAGGAGGLGAGYGSGNMTSRIAMSAKEAFRRRNDLLTALEVTNLTSS